MKKLIFTLMVLININTIHAADEDILLESLGFFTATHCGLSAAGLGIAWDSWINDGFTDEEFEHHILIFQESIVLAKSELNTLYNLGQLTYSDKEFVKGLIELYDGLYAQSGAALKYSYTKKDSDHDMYQSLRQETIKKFDILFDVN